MTAEPNSHNCHAIPTRIASVGVAYRAQCSTCRYLGPLRPHQAQAMKDVVNHISITKDKEPQFLALLNGPLAEEPKWPA